MTLRVLVVDDDFRVAEMHAAGLASLPWCEVAGRATTLAEAVRILAHGGVDLVLADEYLPDGSGSDLIGAGDASVILVTAADAPETVERALVRGAIGYIRKPFAMPVLLARVAAYARFREALADAQASDQASIDQVMALLRPAPPRRPAPKGRSSVTESAVAALLRDAPAPMTAAEVAGEIGVSRATAQRYLSDLTAEGRVRLTLRYGTTGRPEHNYEWAG
ncbi:MAG: response regulator [Propioniciclava sp.]|uniref:response regulator n=1 Tax=Propioniciclava sp. TaxID=2038686 RepID=UPI0039E68403